jgi:RNA polymerase sigma factor (sigma-70 family)
VHNPAYFQLDCSFYISENSAPLGGYSAGPDSIEWTEEEIAAVRTVLHKLTTIRVFNPTDAEDLVQETLLTVLTKYPGGALEKGLLVWCMGILRKKVGNYYRKIQRYAPFGEKELLSPEAIRTFMETASPEAKVFHEELQRILADTLAQLPSAQREAIELLIAGLDPGEVVKQLQPEPYQNVINRIYRGRKKLAKELAKYGYGPDARSGPRQMKRSYPKK